MKNLRLLPLTLATLLVGCDATDSVSPTRTSGVRASVAAGSVWAIADTGETGPGSTYGLFVPANWNGDAVFYAHGFKDISDPISLPTKDSAEAFRDRLGAEGYAVAW